MHLRGVLRHNSEVNKNWVNGIMNLGYKGISKFSKYEEHLLFHLKKNYK